MVSSLSSSNSSYLQELMAQMMNKMSAADTDGTAGLSKTELSTIDTGDDQGGNGFLKALQNNFKKMDTDGNGELTSEEFEAAKPPKGKMGPPPGMSIENLTSTGDKDGVEGLSKDELSSINTNDKNGTANLIDNLIENFDALDTNQDGQLSAEEIQAEKPEEPTKKAESATSGSTQDDSAFENAKDQIGKFSDFFVKQLVNAYKENASSFSSTLGSTLSSNLSSGIKSALDIAV